jgi:hypothetical protein
MENAIDFSVDTQQRDPVAYALLARVRRNRTSDSRGPIVDAMRGRRGKGGDQGFVNCAAGNRNRRMEVNSGILWSGWSEVCRIISITVARTGVD